MSILHAIVLAGVLLLPVGCMKDLGGEVQKDPEKTEEVLLTIANGVDGSATTRGGSVDDDGQITIKNMWVLQVSTKDDVMRRIVQGEAVPGTNQFRVKLLDSSGGEKWKIIIAVNSSEQNLSQYVGVRFWSFATSGKRVESAAKDAPILIDAVKTQLTTVGVVTLNGSSDIAIGRYMGPLSVNLLRSVAKVDIGIGTYNANNTWSNTGDNKIPFTLTSVQLRGSKLKSRLYFDITKEKFDPVANAVIKASTTGLSEETTNPLTYTPVNSGEPYITNNIYMLESWMGGTRYDEMHLNRPRLIIGGRYGTDTQESYYRLDFSGLDGGSKDFFNSDILRNHLYRFTINSVSGPGQSTPDEADRTIPANLTFSSSIEPWTNGRQEAPPQQIGYYMNYGSLNGTVTTTPATGDIRVKTPTWQGRQPSRIFNYNTFYGEAENFYAHFPSEDPGQWNGDLYATANGEVDKPNYRFAALKTEGVYPTLMVASNDLSDIQGNTLFPWKTGKTLTAFDMCRGYNGGGYGDWRLPRLSELALMYANRADLEALNGFEPFRENATYWSGSEYGVGKVQKSSQAWAFCFSASGEVFKITGKNTKLLIRCVRQP